MRKLIWTICSFFCICGCKVSDNLKIDISTVDSLDIHKYMGRWYEIARFDHYFERDMVGCTALYSLQPNETIEVINSGYKHSLNGKFKETHGKARRPNASEPGKLEVSFFLNFYSPYYVLELAPDYRYALIGSKSSKYLWILSRTPEMKSDDLNFLIEKAKQRGYDTDRFIYVKQNPH